MGLKVTDLSNTVRITSFTHYRTVISPINTGGLCTPSTKTSRGSILHTPETNYTLKGRWHTEHRKILSAKQSLCGVWEQGRSNLKRGGKEKREKRIHGTETQHCLARVLWHDVSLAFPVKHRTYLLGPHGAGGKAKMDVQLQRAAVRRTKTRTRDTSMKNLAYSTNFTVYWWHNQ